MLERSLFAVTRQFLFQGSELLDIAQRCLLERASQHRGVVLLLVALRSFLLVCLFLGLLLLILEHAAVRKDDMLSLLVELDNLERKLLLCLSL